MSEEQIIFITGTSNGFGADLSRALASKGHRVYATMRGVAGRNSASAEALRAFAKESGAALEVLEADVSSTSSVNDAVGHMLDREGRVDAVINNAGFVLSGISEAFTPEDFTRQLDTNVVGYFRVAQAVLPAMREQRRGLIINVSSIGGRVVFPLITLYSASKFAIEALTEGLRYELSQLGVEVILVQPGPFRTNIWAAAQPPSRPHILEGYASIQGIEEGIQKGIGAMLEQEDVTDPGLVIDGLIDLVEMEPGTRPVRTVLGMDLGVRDINQAVDKHRVKPLEDIGLGHLDKLVVADPD